MRRYGQTPGFVRIRGAQGVLVQEYDFISCAHCEAVIELPLGRKAPEPGTARWCDQGGGHWICLEEACTVECRPFLKQIDERINGDYHRDQFARIAGLERKAR